MNETSFTSLQKSIDATCNSADDVSLRTTEYGDQSKTRCDGLDLSAFKISMAMLLPVRHSGFLQ